jgi:hypothetical protein
VASFTIPFTRPDLSRQRSGDLAEREFPYASCSSSSMRLAMSLSASWKYLA